METKKKTMYVDGIRTFAPSDKAPDFVLATGVITPKDLVAFLKSDEVVALFSEYQGNKQLRIKFLKSENSGINIVVDTWKPEESTTEKISKRITPATETVVVDDDLPF